MSDAASINCPRCHAPVPLTPRPAAGAVRCPRCQASLRVSPARGKEAAAEVGSALLAGLLPPDQSSEVAATAPEPLLARRPDAVPVEARDPARPRPWYHSPWLVLLVATAGVCLGNLLSAVIVSAVVSARADAELRKLEKKLQGPK